MKRFLPLLAILAFSWATLAPIYAPSGGGGSDIDIPDAGADGDLVTKDLDGSYDTKAASELVINGIKDSSDPTKVLQLDVSRIPTATTRTLDVGSGGGLPLGVFGLAWRNVDVTSSSGPYGLGATAGTGTGAANFGNGSVQITSGATASSYQNSNTGNNISGLAPSTSALSGGINFAKPCGFTVTLRLGAGTTNGVNRVTLGNGVASNGSGNTGKLSDKGIGIEIRNAALHGAVHDGSSYNSGSLSTTLTVNAYTTVTAYSNGSGSVAFYVNGALAGTVTGGPTTAITSHTVKAYVTADNNSDSAAQDFTVFDLKLFQAP